MDLSGGGGAALESQQGIAARIPYENIDANQKATAMVLGTFFHAADMSRKRQQLEDALQEAQLKNVESERWHDIQMHDKESDTATKLYAMGLHEQSIENVAYAKAQTLALQQAEFDRKVGDSRDKMTSYSHLMGDLSELKPGDPKFNADFYDTLSDPDNALGGMTPAGRARANQLANQHNQMARAQKSSFDADMREFGYEVGSTIWGDKNKQSLEPVLHPEAWKDQYVDAKGNPGGASQALDATGNLNPGWQKTENKFWPMAVTDSSGAQVKDPTTGQPKYNYTTLSASQLTQFAKRYKDLQDRRNALPEQISTGDVTPAPTDTYLGATKAADLANQISRARLALAPGSGASPQAQAGARAFLQSQSGNGQ